MRTIAIFADYFGTRYGGINTFNLGLIESLSIHANLKVICLVPTRHCIDESLRKPHFEIFSLREDGIDDFNGNADADIACALLAPHSESLTLIGHDIKTGQFSNLCGAKLKNAFRIVLCHMAYSAYYSLIGTSEAAIAKNNKQFSIFKDAQHVLAVGPKLLRHVQDFKRLGLVGEVSQIIPPLLLLPPAGKRNSPRVTFIGRIEPTNDAVKQTTLALRSIGAALRQLNSDLRETTVHIIGADNSSDEEMVRDLINKEADALIPTLYSKYVGERDVSLEMIRDSSLLLMPSIHEGFGLVAWEAICQGIPVIVSANSGLFELMTELGLADLVGKIDVQGSVTGGARDEDVSALAKVIRDKLLNSNEAHRRAELLISRLQEHPVIKQNHADFLKMIQGNIEPSTDSALAHKMEMEGDTDSILKFMHNIHKNELGADVSCFELTSNRDEVKTALMGRLFASSTIIIDFESKYLSTLSQMATDGESDRNLAKQAALTLMRDGKLVKDDFYIIGRLINSFADEGFIDYSYSAANDLDNRAKAIFSFVDCLNWTLLRNGTKFDAISENGEHYFSFYLNNEECAKLPFDAGKFSLHDGYVLTDFLGHAYNHILAQYLLSQYKIIRNGKMELPKIGNPSFWKVGPG